MQTKYIFRSTLRFGSEEDEQAYGRRIAELRRTMTVPFVVAPLLSVRLPDGRIVREHEPISPEMMSDGEFRRLVNEGRIVAREE